MKRVFIPTLVTLIFASCNQEDPVADMNLTQDTVQEQQNDQTIPTSYSFLRNNQTSVSYSGQTTRLQMGEELVTALKDTSKTYDMLSKMFAHQEGALDFTSTDLNESSKNIRSKTAASYGYFNTNTTDAAVIKSQFDTWIEQQVNNVYPKWNDNASQGNAGKLQEAAGGSTRYVNAKGLELNQMVNKSLIGAFVLDQILNNYLDKGVLDAGTNTQDNDNGTVADGKNYTTMEHKWDEAFGYLYGLESDVNSPVYGVDSFLNKYVARVKNDTDFADIADKVYNAFVVGRNAIVNKDYTTRDQQADIIKTKLSKVIGIRSVYYLESGRTYLETDKAKAFHALSEGYGFIYSLQFTQNPNTGAPYFSKSEVETMLQKLEENNGLWDITDQTLSSLSTDIASRFDFTVDQAKN